MAPSGKAPILLCYDRSHGSRNAINTTASLFPGSAVIVLHVWHPVAVIAAAHSGAVWLPSYDDGEAERASADIADEGTLAALAAGLAARPEVAKGTAHDIGRTILECAERLDAGLVVLGARGLSTFKSIMLGSVSRSVAQQAHIPVLVIPPPPSAHSEIAFEQAGQEAGSTHCG